MEKDTRNISTEAWPSCDFPANRRHLHPDTAHQPARGLGLVALWRDLGAVRSGRSISAAFRGTLPHNFHRGLPVPRLADHSGDQTHDSRRTSWCALVASGRWFMLHSRHNIPSVAATALPPHVLAHIGACRQHVPLSSRAALLATRKPVTRARGIAFIDALAFQESQARS